MAKLNVKDFLEQLKEMTVLELNELIKAIEEEFGVTAAAVASAPVAADEKVDEGPSTVDVLLTSFGASKINVIKVVRELTGLPLKEAKDLVDATVTEPKAIKEGVSEEEANDLKAKLEEAGATVQLK